MNPIIPEKPAAQQPAPPAPTFVVVPEVAPAPIPQERHEEAERIQIAAKVWALLKFDDLTRAQAAIDWSKDVSARLMAFVRSYQKPIEWLLWVTSLGFIAWWAGSRWW